MSIGCRINAIVPSSENDGLKRLPVMSTPRRRLLDEPFMGVAPKVIEEILEALRQIAEAGVTMLLVEQNIHRALDFTARAYVIENGRTVLEGESNNLLKDPTFNKKFLGLD